MVENIKITKLSDYQVAGNFSIRCRSKSEFEGVQKFFETTGDKIKFKDIQNLDWSSCFYAVMPKDENQKLVFIIQYESMQELLKLRELFRVRASQFEMRLIEKRKFNPFTLDFLETYKKPIGKIYK